VKLLLVLVILIVGCTRKGTKSDTLEISLANEISTIDPVGCYDTVCFVPVTQVYESLYEFDYLKRPYTLRPLLAQSMPQVSSDRLTYTLKVKKGIRYHSSALLPQNREVKAQDFINQIKRLAFQGSINSRGFWLVDGKIKGLNEWREKVQTDLNLFFTESVEGLQAPDDETLVITLNSPYPQLLYALSLSFTSPIPEEAIRASKNDFSLQAVGTGAYTISSYNPVQGVELKKNPHYVTSTYPIDGYYVEES